MSLTSLTNSLDRTSRYFRWRRKASTTRLCKIPKTQVTGTPRIVDIPDHTAALIQVYLRCGCRVSRSSVHAHATAMIGGKRFNAGEKLAVRARCGSVVTMVSGGRSVYGLVKKFIVLYVHVTGSLILLLSHGFHSLIILMTIR